MAYVVRRPKGRWEIRESSLTPAGPRARTLATFTTLTPAVIERAEAAAHTTIDRERLARAARRIGVPFEQSPADTLAKSLIRAVGRGTTMRPGLRRLLHQRLGACGPMPREVDESLADWIGCTAQERGAALVELLGLADRLPRPPKKRLEFPGLSPSRLRT